MLWETSIIQYHLISFPCCIAVPPWQDRPAALEHSNIFMNLWLKTWSEILWGTSLCLLFTATHCFCARILLVKLGCCFSQIYELQNGNETVGDVTSDLCCTRWNHTAILPTHTPAGMRALLHLWVCPPSYSPARLDPNINSGPVQLFPAVMLQQFASWRLSRRSKLNRLISSQENWLLKIKRRRRTTSKASPTPFLLYYIIPVPVYPYICHGESCMHAMQSCMSFQVLPPSSTSASQHLKSSCSRLAGSASASCRLQVPLCMRKNMQK